MYGMMVLYVETLTGTAFELHVSPLETIFQIKAKIQRIEGVPVSQQHLIWQSMELEDDYRLHDYGIHSGATLKLVLAMRGGPINTRRIPMEDSTFRDISEYMDANGASELWEKIPHNGNRQVTLLVFRDGDQLNFYRVVDRGDGTLTPISDSMSAASMYNLYDEEEDEEAPSKEKVQENDKMKEKMLSLRNKMENLKVTSKPKKKPRPPSSGKPGSSRTRLRRLRSAHKVHQTDQPATLNKNTCLPQIYSEHADNSGTGSVSGSQELYANSLPASAAKRLENESIEFSTTLPLSASKNKLETLENSAKLRRSLSSVKEDSSGIVHVPRPPTSSKQSSGRHRTEIIDLDLNLSVNRSKDFTQESSRPYTSSKKKEITLDSLKESLIQKPPTASKHRERKRELSFEHSLGGHPATASRKEVYESLGRPVTSSKYTLESLSTSEARAMSGLLRQASLERLGSSRIGNFVNSPPKGRIPTPEGRLVSARLQKMSTGRDGRLPPVKAKKKASKRCFVCAKKTGLATSYQCRCGNNFCATHRYAESHDCTFDYKTEGRKLLEQSNPVVSAPKLPKI